MQGYAELINYQMTEIVELENTKVCLTNLYIRQYSTEYIRGEIKSDILKRVILNGSAGSSWVFKQASIGYRSLSLIRSLLKIKCLDDDFFQLIVRKMEFIDHEVTEEHAESNLLVFSDNEKELTNDETEYFIDDIEQPKKDARFYR